MIQAILSLITAASAVGSEAPTLVKPYKSIESCLIDAQKQNQENRDDLLKQGAGYVCLVVKLPAV